MNARGVLQREPVQSDFEALAGKLFLFWRSRPLTTPLRVGLFAALLACICVLRTVFAAFPQNVYSHDIFIFLDGAWRVMNGQRPQVDFNSNLGPIMYLFVAGGLELSHHAAHALALTQTWFCALIVLCVSYVAFRRMAQVPAMLVTLTALFVAMSPCNTGEEPFSITYAMLYNRVGFGFLSFVLIEATQQPRSGGSVTREEFVGGLLSGFVTVFLFFLKFTYGIMAVVLLAGLIAYRPQRVQRFAGFAIGLLGSAAVVLAYLRFDIGAVVHSLALGGSKHIVISEATSRLTENVQVILLLTIVAALSAWAQGTLTQGGTGKSPAARRAWAVGLASFATLGLLLTNSQREGLPLAALMCIVVASEMTGPADSGEHRFGVSSMAACLVLIGLLAPAANVLFWNGGAYAFSILRAAGIHNTGEMPIASPVASDVKSKQMFLIGLSLSPYTEYINEGLALLSANSRPEESVVTLDFVNPFPVLLHRPPATGGTTCLHYQVTFDEVHHLSPEELLGNAQLVMWPKTFEEPMLGRGIERVYGAAVNQKFNLVAETPMWRLLRRKTPVLGAPQGM